MIEFTTGLLMIVSAFSPSATSTQVVEAKEVSAFGTATTTAPFVTAANITTEQYVREYFEDAPILAEIARCESSFRQFDEDGNVLLGEVNSDDVGVMQINKYYHEEDATKLGLDIYTLQGNLEFAKVLYGKYGAKPWVYSSKCWGQSIPGHEFAKI